MTLILRGLFYFKCLIKWIFLSNTRKMVMTLIKLYFQAKDFERKTMSMTKRQKVEKAIELDKDQEVMRGFRFGYDLKNNRLSINYNGFDLDHNFNDGSYRLGSEFFGFN